MWGKSERICCPHWYTCSGCIGTGWGNVLTTARVCARSAVWTWSSQCCVCHCLSVSLCVTCVSLCVTGNTSWWMRHYVSRVLHSCSSIYSLILWASLEYASFVCHFDHGGHFDGYPNNNNGRGISVVVLVFIFVWKLKLLGLLKKIRIQNYYGMDCSL